MGGERTGVQAQVPTCAYSCMLTKVAIGFVLIAAGGRGRISRQCRQGLNNLERKHWTARHETPSTRGVRGGVGSMDASRLEAISPSSPQPTRES